MELKREFRKQRKRSFCLNDRVFYPPIGEGKIVKIHFYPEYKRLMYVIEAKVKAISVKVLVPAEKIHLVGTLFLGK